MTDQLVTSAQASIQALTELPQRTARDGIAALEPGELLVRTIRDGLTIPPDHIRIAQANWALRNWTVYAE